MVRTQWDVIIVGAGPAGMAAALELRRRKLDVLVLDRQQEPGGQVWRRAGSAPQELVGFLGGEYEEGRAMVRQFRHSGAEFQAGAQVWHLLPGNVFASIAGRSHELCAKQILIATGAMERPVPVPGWTEPGVLGAGAADVLLKAGGMTFDGPVVLCGNGPLILQTLDHLLRLKVRVSGVALTGSPKNSLRAMSRFYGAAARPLYFMRGAGMALRGLAARVPFYPGCSGLRLVKQGESFTASFRSLGRERRLEGTTVLLHEGIISEQRITRLARCSHTWEPLQRYWHVTADAWGSTSVSGIRAAGDCAGVRGVAASVVTGRMAALGIATELGVATMSERDALARPLRRKLARCSAMQALTDRMFAPSPAQLQPADDAIVCRCEELTAAELRSRISQGCMSPDSLKAQSRSGMGTCQGRMCSAAVAEMISQAWGIPMENLEPYHAQPPLIPLSIGELAEMDMPSFGM